MRLRVRANAVTIEQPAEVSDSDLFLARSCYQINQNSTPDRSVQLLLLRETRGANYRLLFGVAFGRGAMSTAKKGRERNSTAAYLRDGISPQHLQVRPVSLSLSLLTPARDRPNGTSPRWQCARRSARAGATGTVPARQQRWF